MFPGVIFLEGENRDCLAVFVLDLGVSMLTMSSLLMNRFGGGVESQPASNCDFSPPKDGDGDGFYWLSRSPN